MNQQVLRNLKAVRAEASAILANIEQVRGPQFRGLVHASLLTHTLLQVISVLIDRSGMATEDGDIMFQQCLDCSSRVVDVMAQGFAVDPELLKESWEKASKISESIDALALSALSSGREGRPFGEG